MRAQALKLCCLFLVAALPAAGDETPWSQVFEDTTEVRVINIEAFVSDKDGQPVNGLARDDFELLVGGEPVDIANFYAVEAGDVLYPSEEPPDAPVPPVKPSEEERALLLVFYIDNANIGPTHRKRVFERLKEFLLASWRPNLQVMLATNERTVMVRQDVTEVPHLVFVALDEIEQTIASGNQLDTERRRILQSILDINVDAAEGFFAIKDEGGPDGYQQEQAINDAMALMPQLRAYSQQRFDRTLESIGVLRSFVDNVGGLPGNKAVIYVGDELALRPGAALFELFGRRVEKIIELGPRVNPTAEASRFDASRALDTLVDHANASGVTLHVLDAAPPASLGRGAAEGSNIIVTSEFASAEESNRRASKQMLVNGTGGRANFGSNDFKTVLEGVLSDFDNHYSLGYLADAVPRGAEGEVLPVEVRLRDPQLKVRHRKTFRQRSTDDEMSQRVLSALILEGTRNPIGVGIDVQEQTSREDGNFQVPLRVKVPLGKLVLLPQGKEHRAQVSLYVAVRDDRGRNSRVVKHQCPIRIPNQDMLVALGRTAVCGVQLAMRGGPHTVAVVVRDDVAGIESTLRTSVDVAQQSAEAIGDHSTVDGTR